MPSRRMTVNLGPSHPAMHGVTRAVVELEGEVIRSMKLDIGFLHRGFEKSCENVTWTQCFPYTDRLNYVSSIMNNVGFALAVEKLCKLDVPERAKYLRVITCEIHRICDHLTLVGAMAMELGAMTVFLYAIEARDLIYDRLAELCGARLTSNYGRIGGVARDAPEGWIEKTTKTLDRVTEATSTRSISSSAATASSSTAPAAPASFRARTRSSSASPGRASARRASHTTSARRRRTSSTTGSTSTSPSARTATTSTAT